MTSQISRRSIRSCLFLIELSAAIVISMLTLVLLKVFHCGSWTVRLSSTFASLWIIKAAAKFFSSESQGDGNGSVDNAANHGEHDLLKVFEARERSKINFTEQSDVDDFNSPLEKNSAMMTETKKFLDEEADGQDTAKIVSSLISFLVTVFFLFSIRLLAIAQHFRLAFRREKTSNSGHGLKSLLDIPVVIGRGLSPSGCSFYIFSFLNTFLGSEHFHSEEDDEMAVGALSFDHFSMSSSSIWIRPPRKHSSTSSQWSWIGLCFGGIELSVTIRLKRKSRNTVEVNPFIRSITIHITLTSFAVGLFPRALDWGECSGVKIDAYAFIDSNRLTESKSVGVSLQSSQVHVYQAWFGSPSSEQQASTFRNIFSWDMIDVSCETNTHNTTAASLSIPSGFAAVSSPAKTTHFGRKMSIDSAAPKKTIIHLGGCHRSRIAAGVNLKELNPFVHSLGLLLRNVASCVDNCNSPKDTVATDSKIRPPAQLVELCASSYIHVYIIPSSLDRPLDKREALSLRAPCVSVVWRLLDPCPSHSYSINDQENNILLHFRTGAVLIQYETITDDSAPYLHLVALKGVKSIREYVREDSERKSQQRANVEISRIVVRVDANSVAKLACCVQLLNQAKLTFVSLQNVSAKSGNNSEGKDTTRKRNDLDLCVVSVEYIDAIVELNAGYVRAGHVVLSDDRIRLSIIQEKASIYISRHERSYSSPESSERDANYADPCKLFRSTLHTYGASFLFDNTASRVEALVTFSPHTSLPVFICNDSHRPNEVSFYAQASRFGLKTTTPSKSPNAQSVVKKAMLITFDEVSVFERTQKRNDKVSLLASSIYKCHFKPSATWPIMESYCHLSPFHLTKILQGAGEFCLTESQIHVNYDIQKVETMSVHLKRGFNGVELAWSPIFQWIQMSFNKRLQAALAHIRNLVVGDENGSSPLPRLHETCIHVIMDPNVTAKINVFVGVKSTALVAIDGGCVVSVSITKYPALHQPVQLKPSICVRAGRIEIFFNDIQNPIIVSDGFRFENTIRLALNQEIDEYLHKKENPTSEDIRNEIATDIDGHPLKEIFYLNIGTCATAKLPPTLFLGDVIDDFNLLPKSLDIGMDCLNDCERQTRVKRFQLLTIECIIPSCSISLLDVDHDDNDRLRDEVCLFIESGNLLIERNTPPELIQKQLNNLDEDITSQFSYGPMIQGGNIQLSISHLMFTVHPLNIASPLVRIGNFRINGCLFLAGLSPNTPGITEGVVVNSLLLCHHRGQCCCPYGVTVNDARIPVKLYTESRIDCDDLDITFGPVMGPSMRRLQECFKRILPSPKDAGVQEPLTWWDNFRFAVHGPITICVDKLSLRWLLDSHTFLDQSIFLTCEGCTLGYKESFSLDGINIDVSMPSVPYDTSVHPSERFSRSNLCFPHEIESMVGKERHPLLFVPSLSTKMSFSWKMLNPKNHPYQHHSIYLGCKDETSCDSDKFAFFRSDGFFVDMSFELPGGSGVVCNWVALRIDVLPWFTHINSTVDYSSLHEDYKQEPLPKFLSLGMNVIIDRLKVAAWYEEDEGGDSWLDDDLVGLCLIVTQAKYIATDDGSKEIVLGGPVKAALLNVSGFTQPDEQDEFGSMDEMAAIEAIVSDFGSRLTTELCIDKRSPSSLEKNAMDTSTPFWRLEQLSCNIDELDYVVTTGQIDIRNQSLARILAGSDKDSMLKGAYPDLDRTTWSILVSKLKILWTLEIRDCLMAISKDLIFTSGYMKSQVRQMHVMANRETESGWKLSTTPTKLEQGYDFSRGNSVSFRDELQSRTGLQYLLRRDSSLGINSDGNLARRSDVSSHRFGIEGLIQGDLTLPTLDIHFSNPQVQLHSKSTGGSVILAMEGAHVEGKKFVKFLVTSDTGLISPADLIRKTEHIYSLTNLEAYALSSNIDVNIRLPWLEVNIPSFDGESKFSMNDYEWKYPLGLRHHEPFAFVVEENVRPILNKFTCTSRQLFHRPPVHYSNEELNSFIEQGLVIKQRGSVADDIDFEIDLLQFDLDSYQFKTTIDVIRNVLLEPPKPHRRSMTFAQDDGENTETRTKRISSLAVLEMERVLWETGSTKSSGKRKRAALRSSAINLVRDLEDGIELYGDHVIRRISYKLSKLVWFVRSQQLIDDVQIAFTGFHGEHCYMAGGSVNSQIDLEDVRVTTSKPGPGSMFFSDPTSVVEPVLGGESSPCQRCGSSFSHSNNDLNSCRFHSGHYSLGKWTCCYASLSAPGCKTAPHTGKERTAVVRVESLPRVVEGITLYSHLEVNIFPSVPHTLKVQISKSISRLFMDYFFIGQDDDDDDDVQSVSTDLTDAPLSIDAVPKKTVRKKALMAGGKRIYNRPFKEDISQNDTCDLDQKHFREQQQQPIEMFFVKVLRVGYVNMEVSLGGFRAIPQTTLNICVREYSKAYKIGSTVYLGQKYLYYLIHEVLKSGASSALRRKKMTTSAVADTDKSEDDSQVGKELKPNSSSWASSMRSKSLGRNPSETKPVSVEDILGYPIGRKSVVKKKKRVF